MIMLIFWSVHKNLMLDRFFSDQMAPPLHLLISPRHAEYLGKWGKSISASATKNCLNYLMPNCMTIVIQSSPKRQSKFNFKRTLSDDSIFYPLCSPPLILFKFCPYSIRANPQREIADRKSDDECIIARISNRVAADWEKNACRQILREMVKAQEIRNDFRRSQKRGCGRDDFFPFCKENHRKLHFFPPLSIAPLEVVLLLLQLYCVYQLKSVQLIPGVALRLNDAS